MSNAKAAANAGTNTGKEVEGTIVLSDTEKQSRATEAKRLFGIVNAGRKATLKDKLEFAQFLLNTKRELKNEFYDVITEEVVGRKQVGRYIKLILTLNSEKNYAKGMSHKNKEADKIEENLALLVEDERVTSLTVEQIDTMVEPTMATIITAKHAKTKEDFLKAIASNKEVVKSIKDEKSSESKTKKAEAEAKEQEEIANKRPDGMNIDDYESLLKEDKTTLIALYQAQVDEVNKYVNELANMIQFAQQANLYNAMQQQNLSIKQDNLERA